MQTLVCCRYKGEKKMDEVTHTISPPVAVGVALHLVPVPPSVPEQPTPLIDMGLINDTGTRNKTESNDSDNKRERRGNNRQGND